MESNKEFGKYEIIRLLGSGATSDVYLAKDTRLERMVALKILKPALVSDQQGFARFTKEAQTAGKLFHDHIATVFDMGEENGRYFIAMQYIQGVSLDQYLKKNGRMPWVGVKKLIEQIGAALAYAHGEGFLHRDIKPNNIMVSVKGDFVLTDFGLTRAMLKTGMLTTTGAVLGTPPYIPPEVWNGKPATEASDQYSLACVIDEAITGRILFSGETPQAIITKHLTSKPVLAGYPPEVPEQVRYILQKALSKESGERFKSVSEFAAALKKPEEFNVQAYLKQAYKKTQKQEDKAILDNLKKKKRRKGCLISALVVFLIFAAAFGVGYLFFRDQIAEMVYDRLGLVRQGDPIEAAPTLAAVVQEPVSEVAVEPTMPAVNEAVVTEEGVETEEAESVQTETNITLPIQTDVPTQVAATGVYETVPVGSGVEINLVDSSATELVVYFYRGDGTPIKDKYVKVYTQKQDLSGKWVTDRSVDSGYTNNAGSITFKVEPGEYIVTADFAGYNWGTAGDVEGQASVPVQQGKQTQMVLRLGRLYVGFIFGSDRVVTDKYVKVFTQELNLSNKWVTNYSVDSGYTDNSGTLVFNLTAGNYVVESDFTGYNWGDATDVEGMVNLPLKPGEETRLIVYLSRMVIQLKDTDGNPIDDGYVKVYYQSKDINGNPVLENSVDAGYTNSTGSITFNLTPGTYGFVYDDNAYYNVELLPGKTTTTDGVTNTVEN